MWPILAGLASSYLSSDDGQEKMGKVFDKLFGDDEPEVGSGISGMSGGVPGMMAGSVQGDPLVSAGADAWTVGHNFAEGGCLPNLDNDRGSSWHTGSEPSSILGRPAEIEPFPCLRCHFPDLYSPYDPNAGVLSTIKEHGHEFNVPCAGESPYQKSLEPSADQREAILDKLIESLMDRLNSRGIDL